MGWAAAASLMMQPSQSKRGGLWAMEAAVVICADLSKGALLVLQGCLCLENFSLT